MFEVSHLIFGFFVKMYVNHIYIFLSLLYNITRLCAQAAYFFDFFELVMLNPNHWNNLKTPLNPGNPAPFRAVDRCAWTVEIAVRDALIRVAGCSAIWLVRASEGLIGWSGVVWIGLPIWSRPYILIQRYKTTRCMEQAYARLILCVSSHSIDKTCSSSKKKRQDMHQPHST